MPWHFQRDRFYRRATEIHGAYGGQEQSGIVTPAKWPVIFVFTGTGGARGGYVDTHHPDGSIDYTGEGQRGDMRWKGGNAALRDHAGAGEDVLVFEQVKAPGMVRFMGQYVTDSWRIEPQPDAEKVMRDAIVFRLLPIEAVDVTDPVEAKLPADLSALRELAIAAAAPTPPKVGKAPTIYARSRAVRDYVLTRSNGVCESCATPAPFTTPQGRPYLEPHHIRRLSDGGPDHPRWVAAICPNCHRRAHFGADAATLNSQLAARLKAKF